MNFGILYACIVQFSFFSLFLFLFLLDCVLLLYSSRIMNDAIPFSLGSMVGDLLILVVAPNQSIIILIIIISEISRDLFEKT